MSFQKFFRSSKVGLALAMVLALLTIASPAMAQGGKNPFTRRLDLPEFPKDAAWFNSRALKKEDLKGKFVLIDFWTYCCINCMHILPELKKLEKEFPNDLVVVGVHSAKFDTEKQDQNILDAVLRYDIEHPVLNDAEHEFWDVCSINSWPTVLLIDPEGKAVWGRSGEFKAEEVVAQLKPGIAYYRSKKLMTDGPFKLELERDKLAPTPLLFPGKVLADEAGGHLFITDSNHHRIVVSSLDGKLQQVIGSGIEGVRDGDFDKAQFNHPQGCALKGDFLYVADTDNHNLRKVNLKTKRVSTIAGTGRQAENPWPGLDAARKKGELPKRYAGLPMHTALSSPWDLWIHEDALYIAMAGPHQIWKMALGEAEIGPYAGNGREDIVDGPLLPRRPYEEGFASFAQPSGLTSDGTWLYVADSEGSSIRAVPLNGKGSVRTVIGTSDRPGGRLFTFGDVDGPKNKALLQHALAVAYHDGSIYVADTYNSKIKQVDAKTGAVTTIAGTGEHGKDDAAGTFDEPAGLAIAGGKLYVADTNNHLIRTVDIATGKVGTFTVEGLSAPAKATAETAAIAGAPKDKKPSFKGAATEKLAPVHVKSTAGTVKVKVSLHFPEGWKINPLAPMSYWIDSPQEAGVVDRASFGKTKLAPPSDSFDFDLKITGDGDDVIHVSMPVFFCKAGDDGVCKTGAVVFEIPLKVSSEGTEAVITLDHKVPEGE